MKNSSLPMQSSDTTVTQATHGVHVIFDMYGCDTARLDDETFLVESIASAARDTGATVLGQMSHKFTPCGVTAIALLAESHISIHTWPEIGYAAVDVFTCGTNMNPSACMALVEKALLPTETIERTIERNIR